ncbi:hypothetical protein BDZ97DRAFT_1830097 [Flammula alnicola]|nr:hypothetical protein BDZ97DRAFT_1830097 [Flammula alnicola]
MSLLTPVKSPAPKPTSLRCDIQLSNVHVFIEGHHTSRDPDPQIYTTHLHDTYHSISHLVSLHTV